MSEPDPRFNEFVIMQAQNAGLFLGQIPTPQTGTKSVNLRAAKSVIDSLEMLGRRGDLSWNQGREALVIDFPGDAPPQPAYTFKIGLQ